MGGASELSFSFDRQRSSDDLQKLGGDDLAARLLHLLGSVPDPARHWQETDDYAWMCQVAKSFVPPGLDERRVRLAMLDAVKSVGPKLGFPFAQSAIAAYERWLQGGGTKASVERLAKEAKTLSYEHAREHDYDLDDSYRWGLVLIETLCHTKKPLAHLTVFLHRAHGLLVDSPDGHDRRLADILRSRLPNPFLVESA